jgi:hypothetical protein
VASYKERLNIPIEGGKLELYSKSGLLLLNGYTRVVIGGRGPYVEIKPGQIEQKNISIPKDQRWRVDDPKWRHRVYYAEYRSHCRSYVKVYWQFKPTNYADYLVDRFYISPFDLYLDTEGKEPAIK